MPVISENIKPDFYSVGSTILNIEFLCQKSDFFASMCIFYVEGDF